MESEYYKKYAVMITPDIKVSKMIDKYPQTLEVLLKTSSHFSKLNNVFLRKTIGSRVTIQQAASVAGVSLSQLLTDLNKAIEGEYREEDLVNDSKNKTTDESFEKPIQINQISPDKIIEIDVREDISSGKDPIYKIKSAVQLLKDGEVLHLINSFEPVPLYYVLGKKGFTHWTEKKEEIFHVYFSKEQNNITPEEQDASSETEPLDNKNSKKEKLHDPETRKDVIEIDVRDLTPPEPMIKILSILPELKEDGILLVHHHREPMMLYDKLEERGFTAVSHKINDNYYKVVITKKGD